ncbi:apolipoprotein N-acyltransferase [Pelagibacteraceae bacterium]|nr:apolipoprotein N-acyltransferase [Pelagibacteraceae bacterium]
MILLNFFILGILSALLFPPFFMLPLGLIVFPYLIKLFLDISTEKFFFFNYFSFGLCYGLGFLLVFLSWIYNPFLINEETKNYAILALIIPIFLSLFFGLGFTIYKYINNIFYLIIFTPFIFLLIELIISNIFYGFPWVTYSLTLSNNLLGFYLLKFFGTYVSSYLVLSIFILPIIFIYFNRLEFKKSFILIIYTPFFIAVIILLIINSNNSDLNKKISLEIFQILSPINKVDKDLIEKNIINKINTSNAEYLVFAENNYPYLISNISEINIKKYIKEGQKVIIGATRIHDNKFYNSFLLLEKNNTQFFDKQILVPFGEFLPFRKYLTFMEKITGTSDFTPGNSKRLIYSNDINILPVICYEIIFNKILKDINENKIDILINITNDSWFGNKIGPYQHFYHSRMRALISNKNLIRVSNNGISAIIDNEGKIINFSTLNTKNNLKNFLAFKNTNHYYFFHNLFLFYLILILLIYFIFIKYALRNDK